MLKRKYKADVNKTDDVGMSALSYCIQYDNLELIGYLIQKRQAKIKWFVFLSSKNDLIK